MDAQQEGIEQGPAAQNTAAGPQDEKRKAAGWVLLRRERDADGKRQEVLLGTDLAEAKLEWARLGHKAKPKVMATMGELFDRYERDIIPRKCAFGGTSTAS